MSKFFFCLCLLLGLSSCRNYKLQREFKEFTEREIVIPGKIRQMVGRRDSVVLNPVAGTTRLVVWVDSMNCSTCRVQKMFEYAEIIDFRKETEGFLPLFVFSPPCAKIDEVIRTLDVWEFDYPLLLDGSGAFSAANPHIPTDNRFHTFLIDKNGKVVLVGDPVNNPALWELYKTTITTLIENGGTMPEVEK